MPTERKTMPINLDLEIAWEPGQTQGHMRFKFEDTTVTVSEGDRRLGAISGCVGGAIEVEIANPNGGIEWMYVIRPADLWRAVMDAHAARACRAAEGA